MHAHVCACVCVRMWERRTRLLILWHITWHGLDTSTGMLGAPSPYPWIDLVSHERSLLARTVIQVWGKWERLVDKVLCFVFLDHHQIPLHPPWIAERTIFSFQVLKVIVCCLTLHKNFFLRSLWLPLIACLFSKSTDSLSSPSPLSTPAHIFSGWQDMHVA